jgi:peptide deformylase/SAM-dependent methyltransferase
MVSKISECQTFADIGIITFDPKTEQAPDILTRPTTPESDDRAVRDTVDTLHTALDALVKHYSPWDRAIGIAAPQLGLPKRMAAIQEADGSRRVLVNPAIVQLSEATEPWRIGCLSLGRYRQISRYPAAATIGYDDETGAPRYWDLTGDDVIVPVHEVEHLDGKLLTDRAADQGSQLFIPREELIDDRILIRNWAAVIALRRLCKLPTHMQTTEQYYSSLFRGNAVDWPEYINNQVSKRQELVDVLLDEAPPRAKILEAGCGTSALSVYLNKCGFDVTCIDNSPDMLALARRCNQAVDGSVTYEQGDLFETGKQPGEYDLVFSHGVLEEVGGPDAVVAAINEALRIGKTFVFSVPTIWDRSNSLNGTENLWTVHKWQSIIERSNGTLKHTKASFPYHPGLTRFNQISGGVLTEFAANAIFSIAH